MDAPLNEANESGISINKDRQDVIQAKMTSPDKMIQGTGVLQPD